MILAFLTYFLPFGIWLTMLGYEWQGAVCLFVGWAAALNQADAYVRAIDWNMRRQGGNDR